MPSLVPARRIRRQIKGLLCYSLRLGWFVPWILGNWESSVEKLIGPSSVMTSKPGSITQHLRMVSRIPLEGLPEGVASFGLCFQKKKMQQNPGRSDALWMDAGGEAPQGFAARFR